MRLLALCLAAATAMGAQACTTFEEDLNRSQKAFDQNEHERALAILRQLESDQGRLSVTDRAHYCYLRGMTDYRIGYRVESRHWLSLASAIEGATPGSLPPDFKKRMDEALKEMNEAVYAGGIAALSNDATKGRMHDGTDDDTIHDSKDNQTTPDKGDKSDGDKGGGDKGGTDSTPPKKKKPAGDDG
ncbi:MAG: hypothetical protein ACRENE_29275 [Polyangiaceae bacterium]